MLATVTVKGQVTLPKPIRDQLKIEQGTRLDFSVNADGSILVQPLTRSALAIVGLLADSGGGSHSVEQMNDAVAHSAVERSARSAIEMRKAR